MLFEELSLAPKLLEAVRNEGYTVPTPIQMQAIPHVLAGRDLMGCAQTGTGKTAAFALPILNRLLQSPSKREPRCLVLVPTRELATQVAESFATYGKQTQLKHAVVIGGVSQHSQERALRAGVDVLVAAPGRLLDLMGQGLVSLRSVEVLVLDEADRMLDMGFIEPIRRIITKLPPQRQNLMFSATMPEEIKTLAARILRNPAYVAVAPVASTAARIDQQVVFIEQSRKLPMLVRTLALPEAQRVIVFTRTKRGANRVGEKLRHANIEAEIIHGNKSQNARQRALQSFKEGTTQVLVATDVAARGIDVDGITHVINFDLPNEPESYVHRIGRTGRAGAAGLALSFCDPSERSYLRDIERLTKRPIPVVAAPTDLPTAPAVPQQAREGQRPGQGRRPEGRRQSYGRDQSRRSSYGARL